MHNQRMACGKGNVEMLFCVLFVRRERDSRMKPYMKATKLVINLNLTGQTAWLYEIL